MEDLTINDLSILLENNNNNNDDYDDSDSGKYESILSKITNDYKINLEFVFTFGTAIAAFFPIVESFIISEGTSVTYDVKETVIYLTICAIAIALKEPKSGYKKIFEELRLRGGYKFLKPLVAIINILRKIFSSISNKIGKVIVGIADMFAYTALFVPFAIVFNDLVKLNSLSMDDIILAISSNPVGKLMSIGVFIGTIAIKHFLIDLVKKLKEFNPLSFSNIKKVIEKIRKFTATQLFGDSDIESSTTSIKKYNDFEGDEIINDNKYIDLDNKWGSLGIYVEKLKKDILSNYGEDSGEMLEFKRIIGKYLDDNVDIRISNSVNLMPEFDKRLLVNELDSLVNESVSSFVYDIENYSLIGKGGFNSFIKVVSALNLPNIEPSESPSDFFIMYRFDSINKERLLKLMNRFKSLSSGIRILNNIDGIVGLYFGLKFENNNFYIEYGISSSDRYIIGEFKFGIRQLRDIMNSKNKSSRSFKDHMKNVNLSDLKILMNIKKDLSNFSPGYFHRKSKSVIVDGVVSQGFYGVGDWNSGMINNESYLDIKSKFKDWVLTKKWKKRVLVNIKPDKFWVYFKIKLIS